ncbi:hypothetical protein D9C73_006753 [Collichthys lucidus]|uniref:Uncharacterized protein n=1 Tax=Collichthys lucidus TaxID=240159 RepID=A0A4U5UDM6_COLLU|nr:hypothetical protein D9C73_006753 [Collichthys lucidus]
MPADKMSFLSITDANFVLDPPLSNGPNIRYHLLSVYLRHGGATVSDINRPWRRVPFTPQGNHGRVMVLLSRPRISQLPFKHSPRRGGDEEDGSDHPSVHR